jgi:hypothetical protein
MSIALQWCTCESDAQNLSIPTVAVEAILRVQVLRSRINRDENIVANYALKPLLPILLHY